MAATATSTIVSPYHPEDADALAEIHNRAYPAKKTGPVVLSLHLDHIAESGGRIWTIRDTSRLVGYAYVAPVPGLTAVLDLQGCIDPNKQRQGFGRFLLNHIIADLKQHGRFELSHPVPTLDTPAAKFLTSQNFFIEHIEQQMLLENPRKVSAVPLPPDFRLATYDQDTAVQYFQTAYDAIFQELPWYQPYAEDWEVMFELPNSADLLFLLHKDTIAGFAWLRMAGPQLGEVEPFGLLPAYQGQGLGYPFLAAAIRKLVNKGVNRVRIGAWQSNERAIHLYQHIGFNPTNTQIYLATRLFPPTN